MPYASRDILRARLTEAVKAWAKTSGFPLEVVFAELDEIQREALKRLPEMEQEG